MSSNRMWMTLIALVAIAAMILPGCAAPTPIVVEKQVPVEVEVIREVVVEKQVPVEVQKQVFIDRPVIETVIVEKEVVVERERVETVVVEKEVSVEVEVTREVEVQVEVVVTTTPVPPPIKKGGPVFIGSGGMTGKHYNPIWMTSNPQFLTFPLILPALTWFDEQVQPMLRIAMCQPIP